MRWNAVAVCSFMNGAVEVTRTILNTCLLFKRLLFLLVSLGVERAQQEFEVLFILLWVGPVLKVADMSGFFDNLGPWLLTGQDGWVNSYGIQNIWNALWFLVQRSFNFISNPITLDGMLRQDQQQLVIQTYRFFNAVSDLISDVHIFWCKPAAYSFLLQVVMQASGKQFILARIADKTGVVLVGRLDQRTSIDDEGITESCTFQERFGDVSFRPFQGIGSDGRGSKVLYGLQALQLC